MRGGEPVSGGAVSKLPGTVPSESIQRSVGLENQGVGCPCGALSDARRKDLHGGRAVEVGAVSELPVRILSKSMQGPIGLENEGVLLPKQSGTNEK